LRLDAATDQRQWLLTRIQPGRIGRQESNLDIDIFPLDVLAHKLIL